MCDSVRDYYSCYFSYNLVLRVPKFKRQIFSIDTSLLFCLSWALDVNKKSKLFMKCIIFLDKNQCLLPKTNWVQNIHFSKYFRVYKSNNIYVLSSVQNFTFFLKIFICFGNSTSRGRAERGDRGSEAALH